MKLRVAYQILTNGRDLAAAETLCREGDTHCGMFDVPEGVLVIDGPIFNKGIEIVIKPSILRTLI